MSPINRKSFFFILCLDFVSMINNNTANQIPHFSGIQLFSQSITRLITK